MKKQTHLLNIFFIFILSSTSIFTLNSINNLYSTQNDQNNNSDIETLSEPKPVVTNVETYLNLEVAPDGSTVTFTVYASGLQDPDEDYWQNAKVFDPSGTERGKSYGWYGDESNGTVVFVPFNVNDLTPNTAYEDWYVIASFYISGKYYASDPYYVDFDTYLP